MVKIMKSPLLLIFILFVALLGCDPKKGLSPDSSQKTLASLPEPEPTKIEAPQYLDAFITIQPNTSHIVFRGEKSMTSINHGHYSLEEAKKRVPEVKGIMTKYGLSPVVFWKSTEKAERIDFLVAGEKSYSCPRVTPKNIPTSVLECEDQSFMSIFHWLLNDVRCPLTIRITYADGKSWIATFKNITAKVETNQAMDSNPTQLFNLSDGPVENQRSSLGK